MTEAESGRAAGGAQRRITVDRRVAASAPPHLIDLDVLSPMVVVVYTRSRRCYERNKFLLASCSAFRTKPLRAACRLRFRFETVMLGHDPSYIVVDIDDTCLNNRNRLGSLRSLVVS
ncbi:hypothetical protein L1987_06659 [Smallanthus sonchifolius]|uniref:Uncharacterized protein n=1 Tax=Smallanthus sonchifolius TaxID=185202 RepID=A0ACB9JYY9_9ASTR|nr:hypothetical protein L1987_06659 [Smallanthus sonchifolius]